MDESRKMEGDYRGQRRTAFFLWNGGVINTVGYPQLVERERLQVSPCSTGYGV